MVTTLYSSFANVEDAEKATGALIDHGINSNEISLVAHETHAGRHWSARSHDDQNKAEEHAKHGLTTTTGADAGVGAAEGAGVGLGVGIAAALAAVFLPGIGIVLGGGALALAIGGAAGAVGAGAIAGGVYGYLKNMGVPEETITLYRENFEAGGAILAVNIPENRSIEDVKGIIGKYNGAQVQAYSPATLR